MRSAIRPQFPTRSLSHWGCRDPDPVAAIRARLRTAEVLLVLDNCEHLGDAPAELLTDLLAACPGIRVLATSQRPVGLVGEAVWRLEPLRGREAADFFCVRAAERRPGLEFGPDEMAAVDDICRRLEGLPLALELAAGRCHVLPVAELAARLPDALAIPAQATAARPSRQQTLLATVAWSYQLLFPDAELALQAIAAFPGGAPLNGLETVLAVMGIARDEVLDLVTQLVDRSLVDSEPGGRIARFRSSESVRVYAMRQAEKAGRAELLRNAQAAWVAELAAEAGRELRGPKQSYWLDVLRGERAAIDAGFDRLLVSAPLVALRVADDLHWAWLVLGDGGAGADRTRRALAAAGADASDLERSAALRHLALLLHRIGAVAKPWRPPRQRWRCRTSSRPGRPPKVSSG